MRSIKQLKVLHTKNTSQLTGSLCICPSCDTEFTKKSYQQVFCRTKDKTICKDRFWNLVDPNKRNNKTRISPGSRRYMTARSFERLNNFDPHDYEHPFSSVALGQW